MGIATFPAPSSGGIKSVQRGLASGAGNVTISAVNISKSFVTVFGTTSSGTVAASGTVSAASGNIGSATGTTGNIRVNAPSHYTQQSLVSTNGWHTSSKWVGEIPSNNISMNGTSFSANATNLSGGSTNLVSAVVQGFLADSTTLTVSGACRWEVVEFN